MEKIRKQNWIFQCLKLIIFTKKTFSYWSDTPCHAMTHIMKLLLRTFFFLHLFFLLLIWLWFGFNSWSTWEGLPNLHESSLKVCILCILCQPTKPTGFKFLITRGSIIRKSQINIKCSVEKWRHGQLTPTW